MINEKLKDACECYIQAYTEFLESGETPAIVSLSNAKDKLKHLGLGIDSFKIDFIVSNIEYTTMYTTKCSFAKAYLTKNTENLYLVLDFISSEILTMSKVLKIIKDNPSSKITKYQQEDPRDLLMIELNSDKIHFKATYKQTNTMYDPVNFIIYRKDNLYFGDLEVKLGRYGNLITKEKIGEQNFYYLHQIMKLIILREIGFFKFVEFKTKRIFTSEEMNEITNLCNTIHSMESINNPPKELIDSLYERLKLLGGK